MLHLMVERERKRVEALRSAGERGCDASGEHRSLELRELDAKGRKGGAGGARSSAGD